MSVMEFHSSADLHRHYAETRNRLRGQKPRLRIVPAVEPKPEPEPAPVVEAAPEPELSPISPVVPQSPQPDAVLDEEPEVVVRPTLRQLLARVAQKHDLTVDEVISQSRNKRLVAARHEYFYLAAKETLQSYPVIGRHCGDRDHTTALWGLQKYCFEHDLPVPRGGTYGKYTRRRLNGEVRR